MRRFLTLALVGALVLGVGSFASANFCAFDPAPAASLLFPFVAFDYNNPINGTTTLLAITNVSSEAQVVHVTLWTDYSSPVLDFNILLSGYDVQTMNIRDILYFGDLPNTVITGPNGPVPFADGPVNPDTLYGAPHTVGLPDAAGTQTLAARCPSTNPGLNGYPDYPPIPQGMLDLLRAWLQASQTATQMHDPFCTEWDDTDAGLLSPDDWFQARNTADVTWMYITADVVWSCNKDFPDGSAPAYWTFNTADPFNPNHVQFPPAATGQKRITNVLIGDVFWVDDAARFSEADNAVHLEADPYLADVVTITPEGDPMSFFYRASSAFGQQSDMREPMPTAWAFRYIGYGVDGIDTWIRAFKQATNLEDVLTSQARVWDLWVSPDVPNVPTSMVAFDCLAYTYFAWDEDEAVNTTSDNPWSFPGAPTFNPNLLPLETQEVSIDQFNMVDADGWVMFLWPASNWDDAGDAWLESDWYQTWMGVKYGAYGTYTAGLSGAVLANFNCFSDQVFSHLGIGYFYVDPVDGYKVSPNDYDE